MNNNYTNYGNYGNGYYYPNSQYGNYPNYNYQQQVQQQVPMQQNNVMQQQVPVQNSNGTKHIFAFVNGVEDARAYIVGANCTAYLKDLNSNLLFEKRADNKSNYTMEIYELNKVNENNTEFVKQADFESLRTDLNKLSTSFENFLKSQKTSQKTQNNYHK